MQRILIVDDDVSVLKVLQMRLESERFSVTAASEAGEAKKRLEEETYDIALFDLRLAEGSGIELMKSIRDIDPDLPVIILTAYGTIESAVEAMKEGAYSYLTKPFDYRELLVQIRNAIEKSSLSREVKRLRHMMRADLEGSSIIARSEAMRRVLDAVALAAETDSNVFISGESGTGKGMVARALHRLSKRREQPFVGINCAAIPATLLESELFGFEKGAFTGAVASKKGLFVQADKGIIFLDEISEIPLAMQGKLLKALEEKEFYPLGAHRTVKVDVRIVSASNKEIVQEVEKGTFRNDLFYRVHVVPIRVPPLRERKEDIPPLIDHFLHKYAAENGKVIKGISSEARDLLIKYDYPGNVRELENILERAVVIGRDEIISVEDLPFLEDSLTAAEEGKKAEGLLRGTMEEMERKMIVEAMEKAGDHQTRAAEILGISERMLRYKLKKYGLKTH